MFFKLRVFLYHLKTPIVRLIKSKKRYLKEYPNKPISSNYGFDRGIPVDRFFIEQFIIENKLLITGDCLEVQSTDYLKKYGYKLKKIDCLDIDKSNKRATVIADLRNAKNIKNNSYDCFVLNQTLHLIDDIDASISEIKRFLKPGGAALITLPYIQRVDPSFGIASDFWRFTTAGCKLIFGKHFKDVTVKSYGNLKAAIAILQGLSQEDVEKDVLLKNDPYFPCIIGIVVRK